MKKLIAIFLSLLFVLSIVLSLSNDIKSTHSNESNSYASIVPIPPPPEKKRGC